MSIKEVTDRDIWDRFLSKSQYNTFMQTWEWGDFQEKGLSQRVYRLGLYDEGELAGICLAVEQVSRWGRFVYCPRGPVLDWTSENIAECIQNLTEFFRNKGYFCLRIDPALVEETGQLLIEMMEKQGFRDAATFVQVERAWVLDIKDVDEETLLHNMRKNSRYYLRQAMKSGVTVRFSDGAADLSVLTDMLCEMSARKQFHAIQQAYLQKEFEGMSNGSVVNGVVSPLKVVIAEKKDKPVAAALIMFYGMEASYLHAASNDLNGKLQAPYAIIWESIKKARSLGLERFNFWGVVKDKNYHPGYPGFGYSNFKRGFGGRLEKYVRTKDYVYDIVPYTIQKFQEIYRTKRYKGN